MSASLPATIGRVGSPAIHSCTAHAKFGLHFHSPPIALSATFPMVNHEQLGPTEGQVHALEHVDQYLHVGQESDASDIHLGVNAPPIWRRNGTLEPVWLQADT